MIYYCLSGACVKSGVEITIQTWSVLPPTVLELGIGPWNLPLYSSPQPYTSKHMLHWQSEVVLRLLITSNFRDWKDLKGLDQTPTNDMNPFYSIYNKECPSPWNHLVTKAISLKNRKPYIKISKQCFLPNISFKSCRWWTGAWPIKKENIQFLGVYGTNTNYVDIWKLSRGYPSILNF
jgi:hypothetical protein